MTKNELYQEIAKILEVEDNTVIDQAVLSDFDEWNSLSVISFIALADEKLHIVVNPKELASAKTIADLHSLVKSKIEG